MKSLQHIESLSAAFEATHQLIICTEGYAKKIAVSYPVTPSSASVPTAVSTAADARVHMPQLPVPKFSGNSVDWPGYYDAFTRLIHQNERLGNIQRFHFLKESLPAGRDCESRQFPLTAANYTVAWDTLIQCAAACNTLNASLQDGDHWHAQYLTTKLPKETHSAWEHHLGSQTPTNLDHPSHATRQNILLATARIIVCHPQSGAQASINALIDQLQ
ncbi:uncharacterized protein LOC122818707 [Drosophila biarmipes]|uniref:uncharacterized protein LOC122818707 n=1 Tax=Drosophila biarmipes TaxID=125945 RepID=UPI001CDB0824|nr:uncharacterized protein LOC122818707 [Drosophila biarmipes]